MPIYEYECTECGEVFSLLRRMAEREAPAECPKCGSEKSKPVLSTFAAGRGGGFKATSAAAGSSCPSNGPFT